MKSLASSIEKSQYSPDRFMLEVLLANEKKAWVFFTRVVVTHRDVEFFDGERIKIATLLPSDEIPAFCSDVQKLGIPLSTEIEDVKSSEAIL